MSDEWCTIKGFNISRPFDHSLFAPDLTPIYKLWHSRKSIKRALISHERGLKQRGKQEEEEKRRVGGKRLLVHRQSSTQTPNDAGILPDFHGMPEFCPTSTGC
ncbi:hypothetical protein MA16_Dca025406 [Dendrobium catenatum]|uniref:Uncharacterized protein n=1 Tax=Dendrobium catenatum TaxID=906689 RepID=A0A2I0WW90_9ASPA|nr:hypothetical protein MA16_Dca025406 [Dendrobium catenatum]